MAQSDKGVSMPRKGTDGTRGRTWDVRGEQCSLETKMGQDGERWTTGKLHGLLNTEFTPDPTVNIKCSPN